MLTLLPVPDATELRLLIGKPDPLILEIGAADCDDTTRFLEAFPECRVICFEPDERPLSRYRRNIPESEQRVTVEQLVVTDIDGMVPWYASHGAMPKANTNEYNWQPETLRDWDMSGSTCRPTGHLKQAKWVTFSGPAKKQGVRLDTYASRNRLGVVDFIWADVQGAEHKMIDGATELLKRTRFLFTEFYDVQLCNNPHKLPDYYEGQHNLGAIMSKLLGWSIRSFHVGDNVLLENRNFTQ